MTSGILLATALTSLGAALAVSLLPCCSGSSADTSPPPRVPDEPRDLLPTQGAPGVVVAILAVDGGSGHGGFFQPGDHVRVRFTLLKKNGGRWNLDEMDFGHVLLSGPSFNYQRVIPEQSDVVARSVQQHDGSYFYTFADPLPAVFLPPLNDTPSFGTDDGERTGEDLLDGTYTVGIGLAWNFTVATVPFVDASNATADFLLGGSAVLAHREAVNQDSCNRCHVDLRYHGDHWRDVTTCLLCHTSGAEDANDPAIGGGTPGVSIDFRVLVHKLHNGRHLPSVLGVTTRSSGRRDYTAPPAPYVVADSDGTVHDYSTVGFPVWPNRTIGMDKDRGWSGLSRADQATENTIHTGVSDCSVCHGDPNPDCSDPSAGQLVPPAQGGLAYAEPSIRSCYSCHDDMVQAYPYVANSPPAGMPAQIDSSLCKECHSPFNPQCAHDGMSVEGAHRHRLKDPTVNFGLHFAIQSVAEAGANDGNGTIDPGEKIEIVFTMTNDAGGAVLASDVAEISAVVSGPTSNANQLLFTSIPKGLWSGSQPFTIRLPELRQLEFVGRSTPALGDVFTTSGAPHLNMSGAVTSVRVRTATTGASSTLATASGHPQNFLDVADATGFARDDDVVVDDGTPAEEYSRIQFVDGNRLWFSSPATPAYPNGMGTSHAAGATVKGVTLVQKFSPADYTLVPATGAITEVTEFGAGNAVLVTYTTEFTMPSQYPLALHASPELDETSGEWTGKDLVPGTYTVSLSGYRDLTSQFNSETNVLFAASAPAAKDFLVAGATAITPYALIEDPANCYRCHTDIYFHEGKYRGFETCIACHGQAGSGDLPQYVAANAPTTTGVTVNFRTLLHQIHRGSSLANAASFQVVAAGPDAYPNNFQVANFSEYRFPPIPGGTMQCAKCHGDANTAWLAPADRNHPTEQGASVLLWTAVCKACHATASDLFHFQTYTSGGDESCDLCHAPGTLLPVDLAHTTR